MQEGSTSKKTVDFLKNSLTLGGGIRVNHDHDWMYIGSNPKRSLKDIYGVKDGPIHFGMPTREQGIAVDALHSDTKATLIKELTEQSGLTRTQAEEAINNLLKSGFLEEVTHPDLGKIIIFKEVK